MPREYRNWEIKKTTIQKFKSKKDTDILIIKDALNWSKLGEKNVKDNPQKIHKNIK